MTDAKWLPVQTRAAHWPLLNAAEDLRASAEKLYEISCEKASWRCAAVIALVAAALEACINIYAGLYYEHTAPGKAGAACAGWPGKWLRIGGHKVNAKWQNYASEIAGSRFSTYVRHDQRLEDWQNRVQRIVSDRNDLVMHFKGSSWTNGNLEVRWAELTPTKAAEALAFTRALVSVLERAFAERIASEKVGLHGLFFRSVDGKGLTDTVTGMTASSGTVTFGFVPAAQESDSTQSA